MVFLLLRKMDWKVQNVGTFLTRMEQKKFVKSTKVGKNKLYESAISEEESQGMKVRGMLEKYYEGSVTCSLHLPKNHSLDDFSVEVGASRSTTLTRRVSTSYPRASHGSF